MTDDSGHPLLGFGAALTGRWVSLRVVTPDDYPLLFHMATSAPTIQRWRFRGATPSFDDFVVHLWDRVLSQFVVVSKASGEVLSLVVAYGADHKNGTAYLGVLRNLASSNPVATEGVVRFLYYLFETFPLRKVYIETPEFNLNQFRGGFDSFFQPEGLLKDHDYYNGTYWDLHILAVYPDAVTKAIHRIGLLDARAGSVDYAN